MKQNKWTLNNETKDFNHELDNKRQRNNYEHKYTHEMEYSTTN